MLELFLLPPAAALVYTAGVRLLSFWRDRPVAFRSAADVNSFNRNLSPRRLTRTRPAAPVMAVEDESFGPFGDSMPSWADPFPSSRPVYTIADAPPGTSEFCIAAAVGIGLGGLIAGTDFTHPHHHHH